MITHFMHLSYESCESNDSFLIHSGDELMHDRKYFVDFCYNDQCFIQITKHQLGKWITNSKTQNVLSLTRSTTRQYPIFYCTIYKFIREYYYFDKNVVELKV